MNKRLHCTVIVFSTLIMNYAAAQQYQWRPFSCLTTPRDHFTGGVIGGRIYALGGYRNVDGLSLSDVEVYDPSQLIWTKVSNIDGLEAMIELTSGVIGNRLYIIGVKSSGSRSDSVMEYEPLTEHWLIRASMPTARTAAACIVYDEEIYVLGGVGQTEASQPEVLDVIEAYDPASDSWRFVTRMPIPLAMCAGAVVGEKVYVLGGITERDGEQVLNERVLAYDLDQGGWITSGYPDIPTPRALSSACASPVIEGKIYCVGGFEEPLEHPQPSNKVEIYDVEKNEWTSGPSLPQGTANHLSVRLDDAICVIGGATRPGTSYDIRTAAAWKMEVVNPAQNAPGLRDAEMGISGVWLVATRDATFIILQSGNSFTFEIDDREDPRERSGYGVLTGNNFTLSWEEPYNNNVNTVTGFLTGDRMIGTYISSYDGQTGPFELFRIPGD